MKRTPALRMLGLSAFLATAGTTWAATQWLGPWRLTGATALWPSHISDQGGVIALDWPHDREMPAVFAVEGRGDEVLVNGQMRGEHYMLDRPYAVLIFRLGKDQARAEYRQGKKP
ncbi:TrbG/VirB9 family P-type conjugative transfer protein [Sphingomonas sp. ASV193]|uniref:TrbG/VirB9 family P-type conjugative transfer protein n=1 Tax=Sphingomonas sp. ASV193 TaxID=3144405 RepID=UPI0032E86AF7